MGNLYDNQGIEALEDECKEMRTKIKNIEEEITKAEAFERAGLEFRKSNFQILISIREYIIEILNQCKELDVNYKRVINSQSSKSVEDRLDIKEKVKVVAGYIKECKFSKFGILGEEGTGKSTFLEYLKEELCDKKNKIIDINATDYDDQEKILTSIYQDMKMSVYADANLKYKYLLFNWREILLNPVILKFIVSIIIIVIIFKFDLVEIVNEVIPVFRRSTMKVPTF